MGITSIPAWVFIAASAVGVLALYGFTFALMSGAKDADRRAARWVEPRPGQGYSAARRPQYLHRRDS